jgi:hypothetical protein
VGNRDKFSAANNFEGKASLVSGIFGVELVKVHDDRQTAPMSPVPGPRDWVAANGRLPTNLI